MAMTLSIPKPIQSAIKRVIAPRNSLTPRIKAAQCLAPSVSPRSSARSDAPTPQAASVRKTDNAARTPSRVSKINALPVAYNYTAVLVIMGVFCAAFSTRGLAMQISAQLVDALIRITPGCGPMRAVKDFEALRARNFVADLLSGMDGDFDFMLLADVVLCSVGTFVLLFDTMG
ncbi:hypothetical protein HBH56_146240 [Parastagonospora nodorum]|nr:hypothetical protein HBH56_146240 [Parastagonospora nodorum]KAH3927783.1 hypothetical protein HBH54_151430 [Parastagonospora nodorum]KAH3960184.1 hypothetical protein HBH51_195290 [Parastagonospora nodorum]KAH3971128.1 hypothetical protein HBH52_160060 [Parastagonospora nodorum]KAH3997716.1 hypothetical protein HBI10_134820 [Parastagonospora nodorum]